MAESYNGWPASPNKDEIGVVQSEWFPGGVKAGDVTTVLRYVVEQFNARVEPVVGGWCWGYNYRANANNPNSLSCHASGTALDINAPEHPNGAYGTFSDAQVGEILAILDEVQGAVHWLNGDDGGTADQMHFEIDVDAATLARIAQELPGSKPPPQPDLPNLEGRIMFCLVQPDNPGPADVGVYRFDGSAMVGVPTPYALGGDQFILAGLGLNHDVFHVAKEWFDSWPIARP